MKLKYWHRVMGEKESFIKLYAKTQGCNVEKLLGHGPSKVLYMPPLTRHDNLSSSSVCI
jgi:hypothetical protein